MADMRFASFIPEPLREHELGQARNVSELLEQLRQGLPSEMFAQLQTYLGISQKALADYLGLSEATLHRRFAEGRFKAEESERLYRYVELFERTVSLFEDEVKARAWLEKPALALGGATPLAFAKSEQGARAVLDLIERLEYGVLG